MIGTKTKIIIMIDILILLLAGAGDAVVCCVVVGLNLNECTKCSHSSCAGDTIQSAATYGNVRS